MALHIGTEVIDRQSRERAEIRHVLRVPAQHDLTGRRIPRHYRYTIVFPDGRWCDTRLVEDLEPAE